MEQPTPADIEALKPSRGVFILLVPLITVLIVLVLYAGTWIVAIQGRAADGERVTLTWRACEGVEEVLRHRVAAIGLGEPVLQRDGDTVSLTATLPADPVIAASIPGTLAERGWLEARVGDQVLFDSSHVTGGSIRQDLTLIPWTVVQLDAHAEQQLQQAVEANREGEVVYFLDDHRIGRISNLKGWGPEIELQAEGAANDLERMHLTAARSVVIGSGPMPCALEPL